MEFQNNALWEALENLLACLPIFDLYCVYTISSSQCSWRKIKIANLISLRKTEDHRTLIEKIGNTID